jgi:hypothetical protein
MRQFRGHSIPVERSIFYMGTAEETSKRRHIDGNNIEPKIVSQLAMEFAQTAPFGLMTPTKARLWWEFLYVWHRSKGFAQHPL